MRPTDAEITRHHDDGRPDSDAWVNGYVQTPRHLAVVEMNGRPGGGTGMDHNRHKQHVVRAIYDRMFRAHGMLP
jgi:hypothetical protein